MTECFSTSNQTMLSICFPNTRTLLLLLLLSFQLQLSLAQCDFTLTVSDTVGCSPSTSVETIVADRTCRYSFTAQGPGAYIAQCTADGIQFLASACYEANCSGGTAPNTCNSDVNSAGNLYSQVSAIPLDSCNQLSRVSPPAQFYLEITGNCSACLAVGGTESPSVSPSAHPTPGPTAMPTSVPTITFRPTSTRYPTGRPTNSEVPSMQPTMLQTVPPVFPGEPTFQPSYSRSPSGTTMPTKASQTRPPLERKRWM